MAAIQSAESRTLAAIFSNFSAIFMTSGTAFVIVPLPHKAGIRLSSSMSTQALQRSNSEFRSELSMRRYYHDVETRLRERTEIRDLLERSVGQFLSVHPIRSSQAFKWPLDLTVSLFVEMLPPVRQGRIFTTGGYLVLIDIALAKYSDDPDLPDSRRPIVMAGYQMLREIVAQRLTQHDREYLRPYLEAILPDKD